MKHAAIALVMALILASCASMQRELSDAEWCQSLGHPEDSHEYTECRAQIDRQRQRVARRGPLVGHSAHQLVLKARDFVFNHQFATLQLNDLEVVDRRMSTGFSYFGFQGAVPPFQFC
jgi:hypothetical protein